MSLLTDTVIVSVSCSKSSRSALPISFTRQTQLFSLDEWTY